MALPPTPNEKRIGPIGYAPIVKEKGGMASDFFARQWQNLVDLVKSVVEVQQEIVAINAAEIVAGVGLDGGGSISSSPITIDLADTAVTPGTYGNATNVAQVTVDAQGRITNAVNVPVSGGGGGGSGSAPLANGVIPNALMDDDTGQTIHVPIDGTTRSNVDAYFARGLIADRPISPPIAPGATAFYYATDASALSVWNGSGWV